MDAAGPRAVSAGVTDAPPLSGVEHGERRRALAERTGLSAAALEPVSSILIRGRRYDVWRQVEILKAGVVPLVTFAVHVQVGGGVRYDRVDAGPPFRLADLEKLPPERAADQLGVFDSFAYDARQASLAPYRRRAAAEPDSAARQHELALMIWYHHFARAPGEVAEAEPPLLRALQRNPRAAASHGLLGEVRLRCGREREAVPAFVEAARLAPGHPRFHYCASVAHQLAGNAAAARESLAKARSVAGPKLKARFTSGSNPLVDYRYSLLCEAGRLRVKYEGVVRMSMRERAEGDRAQNRIRRSRVPKELRALVPLAEKWGIGDDASRGYLLRRATTKEKQQLRKARERYGQRIEEWLDSRLPDESTPETGAFLYLLEACEELGMR